MARMILIDELHVTIMVPPSLKKTAHSAIRRILRNEQFSAQLRRAIRGVFKRHATLRPARFAVSR